MLTAKITITENIDELERLFSLEEKEFQGGRAKYELRKGKNGLEFDVSAKDSVALRAVLNAITKIITISEKTNEVLGED